MARWIPKENRHPNVFLSHSSADKDFVRKLAEDLNHCEIDVWFDEWEIEPGDSIIKAINQGIVSSKYVALIISENFLSSKWATEEVESAFMKQMQSNNKIILPIIIENVEIPPMLTSKVYISFIEDYYSSLTKLAGILHGLEIKVITMALSKNNPQSISEALDTLYYCGLDPHMIIPKIIFDELASTGKANVKGERLKLDRDNPINENSISQIAKNILNRIWRASSKNERPEA